MKFTSEDGKTVLNLVQCGNCIYGKKNITVDGRFVKRCELHIQEAYEEEDYSFDADEYLPVNKWCFEGKENES